MKYLAQAPAIAGVYFMENGWVKIHRKLLENPLMRQPYWAWLWVVILLRANHQEVEVIWNGKLNKIKPGSFITGRKSLAEAAGISESTVERALNYMVNTKQIEQQKNKKYRVVTILNWEKYQTGEHQKTQPETQPEDTNKNEKKVKKYNPLGGEILKAFEEVDQKNKNYYSNTTQRKACDFLLDTHGLEKVLGAIKILPAINRKKLYIGQITTPYELQEKWEKIRNALVQEGESKKVKII